MAHALQGGQSSLDLPTFLSIGNGSLGGKGRSLGFFNSVLLRNGIPSLLDEFNVRVRVPRTLVLTTSVFSDFLEEHNLLEKALTETQDDKVIEMFMQYSLPKNVLSFLSSFLDSIKGPLAVRSSSLFEDAYEKPFAGVYKTFLIPNNEDDLAPRLLHLQKYILFIYGSTYLQEAKKYAQGSGKRMEEERMAVLVQELVGFNDKGLFRPSFSGVMKSYDLYAKENENPKDGVCFVAPGFGGTVVDGGPALQFNPRNPQQLQSGKSLSAECLSLRLAQKVSSAPTSSSSSFSFKTVSPPDLGNQEITFEKVHIANTVYPSLHDVYMRFFDNSIESQGRGRKEEADEEEEFEGMDVHGNIIDYSSFESNMEIEQPVKDSRKEPQKTRLIDVIQKSLFRLPSIFSLMLGVGQRAMANPVEIEFAVNLPQRETDPAEVVILQIRPMNTIIAENILLKQDALPPNDKSILWSAKSLGHGRFKNICDIVFIDPDTFDTDQTPLIAKQVGEITEPLNLSRKPYILIGPGRWGTASVKTGIPVTWSQIAGVSCLVETEIGNKSYEPSQGSHFFQNLTSFGVGLVSVNLQENEGFINYEYLKSHNPTSQKGCVRHIVIDPFELVMDSVSGCGVVLKPGHEYHSIVGQVTSFLDLNGPMWA
uniref:Pyruvate phosphate dikinase AMP/ATP-binding domain-containing protein n=1 Tax=Paramoeba aestuarina TaxID=180227 RepID=A0A7S4KN70_9EUKA